MSSLVSAPINVISPAVSAQAAQRRRNPAAVDAVARLYRMREKLAGRTAPGTSAEDMAVVNKLNSPEGVAANTPDPNVVAGPPAVHFQSGLSALPPAGALQLALAQQQATAAMTPSVPAAVVNADRQSRIDKFNQQHANDPGPNGRLARSRLAAASQTPVGGGDVVAAPATAPAAFAGPQQAATQIPLHIDPAALTPDLLTNMPDGQMVQTPDGGFARFEHATGGFTPMRFDPEKRQFMPAPDLAQQAQDANALDEMKYTAQQKRKLAEINDNIHRVRDSEDLTEDEKKQAISQLESQRFGIKPLPTPKDQPQFKIDEEVKNRVKVDAANGTVTIIQPDGKIDVRPMPKQKGDKSGEANAVTREAFEKRYDAVAKTMSGSKFDKDGNPVDPTPEEIMQRMEQVDNAWERYQQSQKLREHVASLPSGSTFVDLEGNTRMKP